MPRGLSQREKASPVQEEACASLGRRVLWPEDRQRQSGKSEGSRESLQASGPGHNGSGSQNN